MSKLMPTLNPFALIMLILGFVPQPRRQESVVPYEITAIRAYLYYNHSGDFLRGRH